MTLCGLVGPLLRFEFQALDIDFRWVKANRDSACLMVPCVRNTVVATKSLISLPPCAKTGIKTARKPVPKKSHWSWGIDICEYSTHRVLQNYVLFIHHI